ncbi:hypothetical protein C2G38_2046083 [Gigaspora rosea]|uniref:HMG box domain-containing protein n=1 Tax=Gigaspora rosea TaxID=44941 RepID=A0A397UAK0_9GLOM|nr:hypothetical protein C2G38_2046083 [Gigaspora rosea]
MQNRSNSPTIDERESNRKLISEQKFDLSNENKEIVDLVNKLILEFKDVRTTKRLDHLWNSSINTRAKTIPRPQNCFILFRNDITAEYNPQNNNNNNKKTTGKSVPKSSKIAKERWAAVKKNQHEYEFWRRLTEIANLKHKLRYPNYKYTPIRNKSKKKSKRSNNYKPHSPLITDDIIKSRPNNIIEPLQKHEANKAQDLLDNSKHETNNAQDLLNNNNFQNNSTTLPIESYYFTPLSFIPFLSPDYRQNIATSIYNPYINYLHYNPQDFLINSQDYSINSVVNEINPFCTNFSNLSNEKF